ncbi:NUDIX domain-containing protein [Psychrobacillus glaciei]|uniref:NUDIX domain-containing protein n=1 Tax=Psychrobacillus glaciei TaxID=2283160 RepID=A0A5J6SRY2_9BACI|nr:NUDIX domain-containing protein [Psychrobacillus glaciei]QFG00254.1 NUDIX domain-containing protein [Psychrobacillus glaciei]
MDITFKTPAGRFNYRVGGLLIHEGKLLIMHDENQPYYYVPGGRVMLHEKSEDAMKREIVEELSIEVNVKRMLWVDENFFVEDTLKEQFHEICFFYLLELKDNEILKNGDEFVVNENGKKHTYYWKSFDELQDINVYPLFLKEKIANLPFYIEHIS